MYTYIEDKKVFAIKLVILEISLGSEHELLNNFLATENLPKMKLKSVRILLKIIHLASGSHIWSFVAQNHMLTKSKSMSNHKSSIQDIISSHYFTPFISKVDQK